LTMAVSAHHHPPRGQPIFDEVTAIYVAEILVEEVEASLLRARSRLRARHRRPRGRRPGAGTAVVRGGVSWPRVTSSRHRNHERARRCGDTAGAATPRGWPLGCF
jgi:hypothetical protein